MRLGANLPEWLWQMVLARANRDTASDVMREALVRYFEALQAGRLSLQGRFTDGELRAIVESCAAGSFRPWKPNVKAGGIRAGHVHGRVHGAPPAVFAKHGASKADCVAKLAALGVCEDMALVDAIEGFWRGERGVEAATILDEEESE